MDSVVVYTNIQDAANAKYNTYYDPSSTSGATRDAPAAEWLDVTSRGPAWRWSPHN